MKLRPFFFAIALPLSASAADYERVRGRVRRDAIPSSLSGLHKISPRRPRERPGGGSSSTRAGRDLADATTHSTIDGYNCFRDLKGMTKAMFDLEKKYPRLVAISDVGDSYLKHAANGTEDAGHDIYVMKITAPADASLTDDPAKAFLTGGHHPREFAPPELLMRFAERLVQGYDVVADTTWILRTTEIHVILYVNPDGRIEAERKDEYEGADGAWMYGFRMWRKNVHPSTDKTCPAGRIGTDLNRNYDWWWGNLTFGGASEDPCDSTYHGPEPESEPEVRAVVDYAKGLFPEGQRKGDPVVEMNIPYGEDITGLFVDIHSFGGLTYYPWGHENVTSADNDSLEALGRKASYFPKHVLWAGGHPDFLYPVSGDASDYMYAHLGVASMGLEIGDYFYQECDTFRNTVLPDNMETLMYVIKLARRPNALVKGPDVFNLTATPSGRGFEVTADASDGELVNIPGYASFPTGEQAVTHVDLYVDVHPDYYEGDDGVKYTLLPNDSSRASRASVETIISTDGLASGRHVLYAQATDSDGYPGPISSVFFNVKEADSKADSKAAKVSKSGKAFKSGKVSKSEESSKSGKGHESGKSVESENAGGGQSGDSMVFRKSGKVRGA